MEFTQQLKAKINCIHCGSMPVDWVKIKSSGERCLMCARCREKVQRQMMKIEKAERHIEKLTTINFDGNIDDISCPQCDGKGGWWYWNDLYQDHTWIKCELCNSTGLQHR